METNVVRWWAPDSHSKGIMLIKELPAVMHEWEAKAKEVLDSTGALHVIYACKRYAPSGRLDEVIFEIHPCDDNELDRVAKCYDMVCALHKLVGFEERSMA